MSKAPIFPITEPHHFSDYGFDPQLSYFQVLEEAKRQTTKRGMETKPCLDSVRFKLQKPSISSSNSKRNNQKHRRTSTKKWLHSLLFWKKTKKEHSHSHSRSYSYSRHSTYSASYPTCYSSSYSASGPLYMTESYSQTEIATCKVKLGPLTVDGSGAGRYFNLRELNLTSGGHSVSDSAGDFPVYLVT